MNHEQFHYLSEGRKSAQRANCLRSFAWCHNIIVGVGYCTLIVITLVSIYYMVIIAWVLYYLWTSFWPSMEWGSCGNAWNSDGKQKKKHFKTTISVLINFWAVVISSDCYSTIEDAKCRDGNMGNLLDEIFYHGKCQTIESICESKGLYGLDDNHCLNATTNAKVHINEVITRTLSAEEFF